MSRVYKGACTCRSEKKEREELTQSVSSSRSVSFFLLCRRCVLDFVSASLETKAKNATQALTTSPSSCEESLLRRGVHCVTIDSQSEKTESIAHTCESCIWEHVHMGARRKREKDSQSQPLREHRECVRVQGSTSYTRVCSVCSRRGPLCKTYTTCESSPHICMREREKREEHFV